MRWNWILGLALAVLPFAGGQLQESLSQPTNTDPAVEAAAAPREEAAAPAPGPANPASAEQAGEEDMVDAAVAPISTAKPLPAGVKPTGPVAEVLKLVDSAVDEGVMLAFVTNSTTPFNLGVEEIIYLNDIGVPGAVVTAMIQRDQLLKALPANAAPAPATTAAPTPPAQPASEPTNAPAVTDMAPQPDSTTGSYPAPADSTYGSFYDSLAPYGSWVNVDGYGACWQPTVVIINSGWRPYCHGGRWVYSDCGWYWLSGYSWGWAPFHYGRWFCHNRIGWCWQPGNTWGPSWVSWRYSGNYCGWAPLPPAAGFSVGFGLTYHGQRVNSGFAFGLGAGSYTFVPVNHFSDHHPHRYAVPRQQAPQIYSQTVPSTTIVGNSTRVINRGIPVSRVEAATRTRIPTVGIREASATRAGGDRGERLEGNNRTLTVFRPHFPPSTGAEPVSGGRTQPGSGGRSRSDIRPGSSGTAAALSSAAPRLTPEPPSASSRRNAAQPGSTLHFIGRADRPASGARMTPTEPTPAAPTPVGPTINPAPKSAEPVIVRGSGRSREVTGGRNANATDHAPPPNSLIIRGSRDSGRSQASSLPNAPVTTTSQSRPSVTRQDTSSRLPTTQRAHPLTTAEAQTPSQSRWSVPRTVEPRTRAAQPQQDTSSRPAATQRSHSSATAGAQAPSQSRWSAPRAIEAQVPAPRPQQRVVAPTYSAPVQVPRSIPTPAPAAQPARSYTPPAASPAPRAEPAQSQPSRSSFPSSSSQSPWSGRTGR